MGDLPRPPLATRSLPLNGSSVELRSLTFTEARKLRDIPDEGERVAWMVACACDVTTTEADEWIGALSVDDGATVLLAITELSGMDEMVRVKGSPKASRGRKRTSAS
jgi:hypothetical protein